MYFADETRLIRVKLAGAITTNQLPVTGSYVDITVATWAISAGTPIHTVTNSTTVVTLVGSPSAGTIRVLRALSINNADTAAATVTVEAFDSSNARTICKAALAVGDTLTYEDDGWRVLDSNGQVKHVFSDTSIYALLSGRGGGQTLNGGTGASESVALRSTTHSTKGLVKLGDDGSHVQVGGSTAASEERFLEPSGAGTNYVGWKAPATIAANVIWTLPNAEGTAYRALRTNGAAALDWQQSLVQYVNDLDSAVATGTTVTPADDTIPLVTEGVEVLSASITPKATTNRLVVICNLFAAHSAGGQLTCALHQDGGSAIAATAFRTDAVNVPVLAHLHYEMQAGTISSTTFTIRIGCNNAGTTTFNGASAARRYGGVAASVLHIFEYSA